MTLFLFVVLAASPQALFESGDFDAALAESQRVLQREGDHTARARLHLLRARCVTALRRPAEAPTEFERALTEDPAITVEGLDLSPGLRAGFDQARVRLAGTLEVETEPSGGAVRLDGALVGRAPTTHTLPVGAHLLEILDERGATVVQRSVLIAPRQRQTLVLPARAGASPSPPPPLAAAAPVATAAPPSPPPPRSFGAAPFVAARGLFDVAGVPSGHWVSYEAGLGLLGHFWVVEADAVFASSAGVGLRGGGRLPFFDGRLALQVVANAQLLFAARVVPVVGATLAVVYRPWSFVDVAVEGTYRHAWGNEPYRFDYVLPSVAVGLRWPGVAEP